MFSVPLSMEESERRAVFREKQMFLVFSHLLHEREVFVEKEGDILDQLAKSYHAPLKL